MNEYVIENLRLYFKDIASNMISHTEIGYMLHLILTKSGDSFVYDDSDNSIRRLNDDIDNLTEYEYGKEFGRLLSRMMRIKCINQTMLSEMTGISRQIINGYLTGKNIPSIYKVNKITRALGCSIDDLGFKR